MTDLNTSTLNVIRTQNHYYEFVVTGLMPNTKHTIKMDDIDHSFATKQEGKDFGDNLISDSNGRLILGVLLELRFPRDMNFELPRRTTLQFQNEQLNSGNKKAVATVANFRVFELSSANELSKAQFIMPLNTLLTAGPVQTLYPIE